mmetsp:Transcript_16022/g.46084  ORF Transcript_16022/g.46084 Transcript_16022/m.46084 type:complete len:209 (+) Transcript_16022:869-1495(+)
MDDGGFGSALRPPPVPTGGAAAAEAAEHAGRGAVGVAGGAVEIQRRGRARRDQLGAGPDDEPRRGIVGALPRGEGETSGGAERGEGGGAPQRRRSPLGGSGRRGRGGGGTVVVRGGAAQGHPGGHIERTHALVRGTLLRGSVRSHIGRLFRAQVSRRRQRRRRRERSRRGREELRREILLHGPQLRDRPVGLGTRWMEGYRPRRCGNC